MGQGGVRRQSIDSANRPLSPERRKRHSLRKTRYRVDYDSVDEYIFEPSGWGDAENLKQREYRPPSGDGFEVSVRMPFKAKDIFREFCDAQYTFSCKILLV